MSTKKKILLTVLLAVMIGIGVYLAVMYLMQFLSYVRFINNENKSLEYWNILFSWGIGFIFLIITIIWNIIIIIVLWKKHFLLNIKYSIKYGYENYLEKKRTKKEQKLQKKKRHLQNKINKL